MGEGEWLFREDPSFRGEGEWLLREDPSTPSASGLASCIDGIDWSDLGVTRCMRCHREPQTIDSDAGRRKPAGETRDTPLG